MHGLSNCFVRSSRSARTLSLSEDGLEDDSSHVVAVAEASRVYEDVPAPSRNEQTSDHVLVLWECESDDLIRSCHIGRHTSIGALDLLLRGFDALHSVDLVVNDGIPDILLLPLSVPLELVRPSASRSFATSLVAGFRGPTSSTSRSSIVRS